MIQFATATVGWKQRTGSDAHGQGVYAASVSIKARWEAKTVRVKTDTGEVFQSQARALTAQALAVGDVLTYAGTDYVIRGVTEHADLVGNVLAWEAML